MRAATFRKTVKALVVVMAAGCAAACSKSPGEGSRAGTATQPATTNVAATDAKLSESLMKVASAQSEKCDRFEDVTKRVCIRSFSVVLGRELSSYSDARQEEENNFTGEVCRLAVGYMKQMCTPEMGNGREVSECEFISNIVEGTMQGACMDVRNQNNKFDKSFHVLGPNQRLALCKKAFGQAKATTLLTCK